MSDVSFVHIGDFHAGPGPRNVDRFQALDQILDECVGLQGLGAWLWPGDLNHGRMTIEDRNALAQRLQRMAAVAPVVIVYGNHDLPGDLEVFGRLRAAHPIIVVERPTFVPLVLPTGDQASIFCLPYPTKAGLVSAGVATGDVVATAAEALEFIFMDAAAQLAQLEREGVLTLMIGHVNVAGSMTSVGQPNIGHEIEIGPAHLDRLGGIYKGLNHIHKGQVIAGAWYPGSVCRLDWGEIETKRYLRIEYARADTRHPEHGWVHEVFERPISVRPMYHVEGQLTRDGFTWAVKRGPGGQVEPAPASWRGCDVRVRYTFPQSERNVLLHARVQAEFAEAVRLELEPIATPDRELRAPAVATARTLAEKLGAFAQVEQIAPSIAEKLARLEHGDHLQLLADLQRDVTALEAGEEGTVTA